MSRLLKITFCILLTAALTFGLLGCAKVSIKNDVSATLKFIYGDKNVTEALTEVESEQIKAIFNGKVLYSDSPSCSFSENISIVLGDQVFAIACDDCNIVKDCQSEKFFNVSEAEKEIIIDIFKNHGGYFPCV